MPNTSPNPAETHAASDDVLSAVFRLQVAPPQFVVRVDLDDSEQARSEGAAGSCLCIVLEG